jgi:hypothetical protein
MPEHFFFIFLLCKEGGIIWVFGKYVPDILEAYYFQNPRFLMLRPCHGRGDYLPASHQ